MRRCVETSIKINKLEKGKIDESNKKIRGSTSSCRSLFTTFCLYKNFVKPFDLCLLKHFYTPLTENIARWQHFLFFFAAYVKCKKNHSVGSFFFISDQSCQLFIQKQMTAVGLGQQGSQAVGSGFQSLPCQTFLRFIPNNFQHPFSAENLNTPPSPILSINFFATGNFLKQHRRVLLRIFSVLWDKKFSTENRDNIPPPLIHKLFRYRKFSETAQKGSPMKIFCFVRQKIFGGKNFFSTGNFLKHSTEGFLDEIFRHCETKIFQRKILLPFCIKYRKQWWNWCLYKLFEN